MNPRLILPRGGLTPLMILGLSALIPALCGCPKRTCVIKLNEVINTAADKDGYPLEVDIVSVIPKDFKGDVGQVNADLKPPNIPDTVQWFKKRPISTLTKDSADSYHYRIPKDRFLSFTSEEKDKELASTRLGGALVGAKYLKNWSPVRNQRTNVTIKGDTLTVSDVPINEVFDRNAVIYIFCRFEDEKGETRNVPPAIFHEVGDFTDQISIHIREKDIVRTSPRTFGKDLKDEPVEESARRSSGSGKSE